VLDCLKTSVFTAVSCKESFIHREFWVAMLGIFTWVSVRKLSPLMLQGVQLVALMFEPKPDGTIHFVREIPVEANWRPAG
jgi:hypothetical protein